MYVTVKMALVLITMGYLFKRKIAIGYVMLAASVILFIKENTLIKVQSDQEEIPGSNKGLKAILYAIGPILLNIILVTAFLLSALLRQSGVSPTVLITLLTLAVGVLTGQITSFVAITFPIINVIAPGNINLVTIGFVMGVIGTMLSPAHLCLVISLDYFKASILNSLKPVALMSGIITALVFILN